MRISAFPSFASTQKLDMVGKTNQHQRFIGKTLKEFRESETVPPGRPACETIFKDKFTFFCKIFP